MFPILKFPILKCFNCDAEKRLMVLYSLLRRSNLCSCYVYMYFSWERDVGSKRKFSVVMLLQNYSCLIFETPSCSIHRKNSSTHQTLFSVYGPIHDSLWMERWSGMSLQCLYTVHQCSIGAVWKSLFDLTVFPKNDVTLIYRCGTEE